MGDKCYICGNTKGNETVIGGYGTRGKRLICANYNKNPSLHDLLERKIRQRDEIQDEINTLQEQLRNA